MVLLIILAVLSLTAATCVAAMNLSLLHLSRAALQRRLDEMKRSTAADWLYQQQESAALATALLRTIARMLVYVFTVAAVIGLDTQQTTVTWGELVMGAAIAAVAIWFATIVIAGAVARHAGTLIIARTLPLLRAFTMICLPFSKAGEAVQRLAARYAGPADPAAAEDDLLQSIEDTHREGGLDIMSAEILENVVEFSDKEVSQIMTPRPEIQAIEFTNDLSVIRTFLIEVGHSRIPVYRGSIDSIVGILYAKDLVRYLGADASGFSMGSVLRQPIVVPETKPVKEMLTEFQHGEVHMAVVIDEYGAIAGLVTIEDVLEEIVGEIRDEHESEENDEPKLIALDDRRAEVDGRFRIHELNDRLRLHLPEERDYDTLAGFVLDQLGRVPDVGEAFDAFNARFTALAATPTHVQRVGIELLEPRPVQASPNGEQADSAAIAK